LDRVTREFLEIDLFGARIASSGGSKSAQHVGDRLRGARRLIRGHVSGVSVEAEQPCSLGTQSRDLEYQLTVVVLTSAVASRARRNHDALANVATCEVRQVRVARGQDEGHEVLALEAALLCGFGGGGKLARAETVEFVGVI